MDLSAIFALLMVLCSGILLMKWVRTKKLNLPPGPRGLPILGNILVLFTDSVATNDQYYYTRCAKQYGDIYKLSFGPQLLYVLCKFDYVREAFNHSDIQGRPPSAAYPQVFGPQAKGIILARGSNWKVLKQFTATVFRDLGVGKGVFESRIKSELERLSDRIDLEIESTCSGLSEMFYLAISNITCGITFGRQFSYDDDQFKHIVRLMKTYSASIGPSAIVLTSRILCGLPFGPGKTLRDCLVKFKVFLELQIKDAKAGISSEVPPNNFTDAFLHEMKKGDENFNEDNLIACCLELFFAGTETTSGTLSYLILCMVIYPEIQEKVQKELDSFINENGAMPTYSDRSKLPYVQSVILEVHRLLCVAPLGVPHVAERDLRLFGYDIPQGTLLAPNVGSIFMDPNVFPDPKKFNPQRFLRDGQFQAVPDVIPFSTGRRACMGEQLARMELFLFVTFLLHRYSFVLSDGVDAPSILEARYGGTRVPLPYSVSISKRMPLK